MGQTKKTDNHYLKDKVRLRAKYIPDKPFVLDCYAGNGVIWREVQKLMADTPIIRLAIEKEKSKGGFHLAGDNVRFLMSLDLSAYNVIDLDAYGIPYQQIKILFDRQYHGLVFFTFIQSIMGNLPHGMLMDIGFSKAMITKAPTLCARRGWDYFIQFLSLRGVDKITYTNHNRKYYGLFIM